ncbi:MAG TPA: alpha/beta family hydrolase [Acidimicrobiales bacterium]|nr:alpha/beta family hydrolase [Acidimicrobiales bacterium]
MTKPRAGLLLTPGASATRTQPSLVAIDAAVTAVGLVVERMNFPYADAGRRAPDRPPILLEAVRAGAAALAKANRLQPEDLFLGGRSMGGRMCSMAVADGLPAKGLVLVSYPLHPPGRPDKLRTDHFPALDIPCLFASGTKDTFGTPSELEEATTAIPGGVTHVWIDGGDHGLRGKDAVVAEAVVGWIGDRLGG